MINMKRHDFMEYNTTEHGLENSIEILVRDLLPHVADRTIIDGGNFQIRDGNYKTHYISTATFRAAVKLYKRVKDENKAGKLKRRVALAFLIDDFSIKIAGFKLPDEYEQILNRHGIRHNEILYFRESNLKNRCRNTMMRLLAKTGGEAFSKEMDFSKNRDAIFLECEAKSPEKRVLVGTIHREAEAPTPFGAMLLAQRPLDIEKRGYRLAINFMHTGSYEDKAGKFVDVYYELGGRMKVINAYFEDKNAGININIAAYKAPPF